MQEPTDLWGHPLDATPRQQPAAASRSERDYHERQSQQARARERVRWASGNPMLAALGAGPDGAQCGSCVHLLRLPYHGKTYIKCRLRGITHGTGTDHRVRWPACAKYERTTA